MDRFGHEDGYTSLLLQTTCSRIRKRSSSSITVRCSNNEDLAMNLSPSSAVCCKEVLAEPLVLRLEPDGTQHYKYRYSWYNDGNVSLIL